MKRSTLKLGKELWRTDVPSRYGRSGTGLLFLGCFIMILSIIITFLIFAIIPGLPPNERMLGILFSIISQIFLLLISFILVFLGLRCFIPYIVAYERGIKIRHPHAFWRSKFILFSTIQSIELKVLSSWHGRVTKMSIYLNNKTNVTITSAWVANIVEIKNEILKSLLNHIPSQEIITKTEPNRKIRSNGRLKLDFYTNLFIKEKNLDKEIDLIHILEDPIQKNYDLADVVDRIRKFNPKLLEKIHYLQPNEIFIELYKHLEDPSGYKLMEIFNSYRNGVENEKHTLEIMQKINVLQEKINKIIAYIQVIPEYKDEINCNDLYQLLIKKGLTHPSFVVRKYILKIMFTSELMKEILQEFELDDLFNYLPSSKYIREVDAKNFVDSHLDPIDFIREVRIIFYNLGNEQLRNKFYKWIISLQDQLQDTTYYSKIVDLIYNY